jgi:hypothetical protein
MLIKEGISLLGRNHKLGLFIIMASISIPAVTQINIVATTAEYSQKKNLGNARPGSYLTQATVLVYDDILRFQKGPNGYMSDVDINAFIYDQFAGNVIWFMDELVGIESDWKKRAAASSTTAYGYVQFTKASVDTAVNRYINHLKSFNARKDSRLWQPWGIPLGTEIPTPTWLTTLKNSTKTHKEQLDLLTYDQTIALAFVHLHGAAKEIYKKNHHTNPDAATLSRLTGFFKYHIRTAPTLTQKIVALSPGVLLATEILAEIKTSRYATLMNKIKSFFGFN